MDLNYSPLAGTKIFIYEKLGKHGMRDTGRYQVAQS